MKKVIICVLLVASVCLLAACEFDPEKIIVGPSKYKITFDDEYVYNCPKKAKAGETITFETVIVCDADLYAYINGTELKPIKEGYYEFVMPNNNVEIKIVIKSNGLA